jgi:hypothetical protein
LGRRRNRRGSAQAATASAGGPTWTQILNAE